jgi:hypothetical protein
MKSQTEEQKTTETKKPRFKIEKLEERIAPAKGGIPGPPEHSNGGGCNYHNYRHKGCRGY